MIFFIFVLAIMKISSYNRFLVLHACLSNSSLKSKRVGVEMKKWFTVWKKKKQKLIMDNRINALWFYRLLNFIFRNVFWETFLAFICYFVTNYWYTGHNVNKYESLLYYNIVLVITHILTVFLLQFFIFCKKNCLPC